MLNAHDICSVGRLPPSSYLLSSSYTNQNQEHLGTWSDEINKVWSPPSGRSLNTNVRLGASLLCRLERVKDHCAFKQMGWKHLCQRMLGGQWSTLFLHYCLIVPLQMCWLTLGMIDSTDKVCQYRFNTYILRYFVEKICGDFSDVVVSVNTNPNSWT